MHFADTLSRAYLKIQQEDLGEKDPVGVHTVDYREHLPVSEQRFFNKIREATERDETMEMLKGLIDQDWMA